MKRIIGLIAAAAIIWSAEAEEKRLPPLSVETEIAATVRPTHAYILFLADGRGLTVSDALRDCNQKTAAVSEAIRRQFPDAAIETEIVNTGNRDSENSDRDSFAPDVTRLIQVTIPADARRAAQILDIALRMGLTPFLASLNSFASDQLSCSGAIFYGIRNLDADVDRLCETAYPKLWKRAEKLAKLQSCKVVKLQELDRYFIHRSRNPIKFQSIAHTLPVDFYSGDPEKIRISLSLDAKFEVMPIQELP